MTKAILIVVLTWIGLAGAAWAQQPNKVHAFTHADSLLGGHRPERDAFDAQFYALGIKPNFEDQSIKGSVVGYFKVEGECPRQIQIDLDSALSIDSILIVAAPADGEDNKEAFKHSSFTRTLSAVLITIPEDFRSAFQARAKSILQLITYYHGSPSKAARPPWDGGLIWRKDSLGRDWLTVACQGDGAHLWWPCKDVPWDEPERGIVLKLTIPQEMATVSNGKFEKKVDVNASSVYYFRAHNPINLYNVTMNVGHYASRDHTIKLESGKTVPFTVSAMDYHIDSYDQYLHFEGERVIKVFSKLFGDYPWASDGYRLVETPYWGMEHQSCVAYGNKLKRNEYGFDFIVVHETGHEWWGNLLSAADNADFWLHEGFCTYAEVLFLEEVKGQAEAERYFKNYVLKNMTGKGAIVGPRGVAYNGYDAEPYYRGAALIHLMRYCLGNDKLFRQTLRDILDEHRKKPATTASVLAAINKTTGKDFAPLFYQFLGDRGNPIFEYKVSGKKLHYRLTNATKGLELPIIVKNNKKIVRLRAIDKWQYVTLKSAVQTTVPTVEVLEPSYLLNSREVRD